MSKDNERIFIIAKRNVEPCPPEFMYYCGAAAPINNIQACVNRCEARWDIEKTLAYKFSFESAAKAYGALTQLGFTELVVFQIVTTLQAVDSKLFKEAAIKDSIGSIIDSMEPEDIKYLQNCGVLDLSILD